MFQAANVHLTPCTLELGGKSPVYVDENCNVEVAVKRLLWGKMVNLGQTVIRTFVKFTSDVFFFC